MPGQQPAPNHRCGVSCRTRSAGADHEGLANRSEALERLADLGAGCHDCEVVTGAALWLDSVAGELDPLEDSLLAEDELVDVSELVVGVLELVEDVLFAVLLLATAVFAAVLFGAEAVTLEVLVVLVPFFVERAGSCPEASWTYTARNAPVNSAAARPLMARRMRRTRRRIAERRLVARARASGCFWERSGVCSGEVAARGSMVTPIGWGIACKAVSALGVRVPFSDAERILSGDRRSRCSPWGVASRPHRRAPGAAHGKTCSPVARSVIRIATAGQTLAASSMSSSGPSAMTTAMSSTWKISGAIASQSPCAAQALSSICAT
jgi:hypothetical protein